MPHDRITLGIGKQILHHRSAIIAYGLAGGLCIRHMYRGELPQLHCLHRVPMLEVGGFFHPPAAGHLHGQDGLRFKIQSNGGGVSDSVLENGQTC